MTKRLSPAFFGDKKLTEVLLLSPRKSTSTSFRTTANSPPRISTSSSNHIHLNCLILRLKIRTSLCSTYSVSSYREW